MRIFRSSNDKKSGWAPCCFGVGGYIIQLYRDNHKTIKRSLSTNEYDGMSCQVFFRGSCGLYVCFFSSFVQKQSPPKKTYKKTHGEENSSVPAMHKISTWLFCFKWYTTFIVCVFFCIKKGHHGWSTKASWCRRLSVSNFVAFFCILLLGAMVSHSLQLLGNEECKKPPRSLQPDQQ